MIINHPYQNNITRDPEVLRHRLNQVAEENRLTYLLSATGGDRFIGRLTATDEEDCYLIVNTLDEARRIELSRVRKVRLVGTNGARVELF